MSASRMGSASAFGRDRHLSSASLALALAGLVLAAAVSLLPLPASVAIAVGGGVGVLTIVQPVAGLAALAVAVPFGSVVEFPLGGIAVSGVELLAGILLMSWLARLLSRRDRVADLPWPLWLTVVFLAVVAFEFTRAPELAPAMKELLRWTELLIVAVVGSNLLRDWRQRGVVLAAILIASSAEALTGWYQFFLRAGPPSFAFGRFLRAYGTFEQPNPFAGYLVMVWPLALSLGAAWLLGWLGTNRGQGAVPWMLGLLGLGTAAVTGAAILMSLSRGAWLGLAAAIVAVTWMYHRRAFALLVLAAGLMALLVLLGYYNLIPGPVLARMNEAAGYFRIFDASQVQLTPQNWAVVERMASWQAAWGMFQSAPVFGVGPGNYDAAYPRFALEQWPEPLGHAHNYYLNVLAEMGAVGLGAYLLALAGWFAGGLTRLRRPAKLTGVSLEHAVVAGVLAALVAAAVHNGFDNLYVHGMNVHVGLLLAVALSVPRSKERQVRIDFTATRFRKEVKGDRRPAQ